MFCTRVFVLPAFTILGPHDALTQFEGMRLAPYGGGYAKNPDKEQLEQLPVQSSPGFLVADGLLGMFI